MALRRLAAVGAGPAAQRPALTMRRLLLSLTLLRLAAAQLLLLLLLLLLPQQRPVPPSLAAPQCALWMWRTTCSPV